MNSDIDVVVLRDALRSLSCRFFLNLPEEELKSFERIFYHLEQAHWFYEDFEKVKYGLPSLNLDDFCYRMFLVNSSLSCHLPKFREHFSRFRKYMSMVPTCGVILLDSSLENVVLVKGFYGNSWFFPKGKINEGESSIGCAIREAKEEVGIDISGKIDSSMVVNEGGMRLFVITGVSMDYKFETHTRNEIAEIRWFSVNALGSKKKNQRLFRLLSRALKACGSQPSLSSAGKFASSESDTSSSFGVLSGSCSPPRVDLPSEGSFLSEKDQFIASSLEEHFSFAELVSRCNGVPLPDVPRMSSVVDVSELEYDFENGGLSKGMGFDMEDVMKAFSESFHGSVR